MEEKYTWQTKYVWYVVTDEGRLVHPGDDGGWTKHTVLSRPFDTEEDAIVALKQFYKDVDYYIGDHHILQKVYVKVTV